MSKNRKLNVTQSAEVYFLLTLLLANTVLCCGPGRGSHRRKGSRKMTPLVYKQHVPNISETTFGASGSPEGRISRGDARFQDLVVNYNADIIFKDEEGTNADRIMTQRCKDKLNILAILVMNQWSDLKVRVTEGWDEDFQHDKDSLHYEGRALDITTSDRDRSKYGMLARLAVEAGFDWVYYQSRGHIHVSVKSESSIASNYGGCFPPDSLVHTEQRGTLPMSELQLGERVMTIDSHGRLAYSDVILFFHKDAKTPTDYLQIETASGQQLTITANHLMHTSRTPLSERRIANDAQVTFASSVKRGHYVYYTDLETRNVRAVEVQNITTARMRGMYAPLTKHGTIVVDNYVTSCYAYINSASIAHACLAPIRLFYDLYNAVVSTSIVRHLFPSDSRLESTLMTSHNQNGVHWYADILHSIAYYVIPHSMLYNT